MTDPHAGPGASSAAQPAASVDALHPGQGGRWLVVTKRSEHIWDLDAMVYVRLPGPTSKQMPYDGVAVPISRVERWPAVGQSSVVFYDDPQTPALEQWRVCSTIRQISRLALDGDGSAAPA